MRSSILGMAALAATTAMAQPRYIIYYDQYHTADLPDKSLTAGINYVITAFANSSLFASEPAGTYEPFTNVTDVRSLFDIGTKVCMAIGGWGDNTGFAEGAKTPESRKAFAKNVADTLDRLGYDCVDVDWEFPGGNGEDYIEVPNSEKVDEIEQFPLVLAEIKAAIGDKELSIAVPGHERDMMAFEPENCAMINEIVDFVNVMTYDMMYRRNNITDHHVSLSATLHSIDTYIARGFEPSKLNFGIPFYAKFFTTKEGLNCTRGLGCETEVLEDDKGKDTGKSGVMTFEKGNFAPAPTNLTASPDLSCGVGTFFQCDAPSQCCSLYGWCGNTTSHCGTGCQSEYGECDGTDIKASFKKALLNGHTDAKAGGQWYWDAPTRLFWTWDTPELIAKKISKLQCRGVGGFFAWSLGEDGNDWSHLKAMQRGYEALVDDGRSKVPH